MTTDYDAYGRHGIPLYTAPKQEVPAMPSDADIDAFLDSPGNINWVIADKRERYRLLVRAVLANWAAPQPSPAAQGAALDAARYAIVRRGQHWSVIDGLGEPLTGDRLDAAVDAVCAAQEGKP